ncbi:hypothetical protein EVAR_8199_1 [Eumeta japonica]|uniref:Uncharacterized protein n=1 Tax=Eumeta variegata TaxID=151549 RepID=A0A4C1TFJ9_EUMVA|nr:hypothetical protein EVAR_8199_1 [Eumeta japonica]
MAEQRVWKQSRSTKRVGFRGLRQATRLQPPPMTLDPPAPEPSADPRRQPTAADDRHFCYTFKDCPRAVSQRRTARRIPARTVHRACQPPIYVAGRGANKQHQSATPDRGIRASAACRSMDGSGIRDENETIVLGYFRK